MSWRPRPTLHLHRRRHGQFWNVYLHGLLLLVLVAGAVALTGLWFGQPPWQAAAERLGEYLTSRAAEVSEHPGALARDLALERDLFGIEVAIFRLDGTLIADSGHGGRPPPTPSPADLARLFERSRPAPAGPARMLVPITNNGVPLAYAVVARPAVWPHLARGAVVLVVVLVAIALGSMPLARAIARPLEQLTRVAEQLGSGDLSVRTGIRRRDEIGELARALDDMADRLARLIRGEKELLANVSHELRTPISRIRVALELAAEGDAAHAQRYLGELGADLGELERLVEDVLTTARLDLAGGKVGDGAPPLRRATVDLPALLEDTAARFRSGHPERTLELVIEDELPAVSGDAALLRRAIANLVDNARKYSDDTESIALVARMSAGQVELVVRDHGIGIDARDLPNLFTPFFRTDRSRARGTGGVGLGLALVRSIVEAHRGTVLIESRPNLGTTVCVRLPSGGGVPSL